MHTDPASGAVLETSPAKVTLVYDEPVTTSAGALGVYDAAGKHVDSGRLLHPTGDTIAVAIPHRLPHGTYTVAWRVTSADTHVVHGAFTFSVGAPGRAGGITAKLLAQDQIPASLSDSFAAVRFANFLLLLLCGGGALALVLVLRDAAERLRRRLARSLAVAGALLCILAALGLPFEAAENVGSGLGGGFAAAALEQVRGLRFGQVWLFRAWLALLFALLALALEHGRRRPAAELGLLAAAAVLLLTPTAAGHADVDGPFAFAVDAAHVVTAAVWLGGLAFVGYSLAISPREGRWALAARVVPRFSAVAVAAVTVLLVAGGVNAYLEVRAWRGLWQSTYGELVLVKAALALPLIALGAFNNRVSVPQLRDGIHSLAVRRRFLRAVGAELGLLLLVLGVTSVLVSEAPAKNLLAQKPASSTSSIRIGPFSGKLTVTPATAGPNTIDLSFTNAKGEPATLAEVDVAASLPSRHLGPLRFTAHPLGHGRFRVTGASFAIAGNWRLRTTVRRGQIDEWLKTTTLEIGKERS